jgi:hypothetical protein
VGDRVESVSYESLGQVVTVYAAAFTLQGHGQTTCLSRDCIYSRDISGRITLICNASGLRRYLIPQRNGSIDAA